MSRAKCELCGGYANTNSSEFNDLRDDWCDCSAGALVSWARWLETKKMAAYTPLDAETNTLRASIADLPLVQSIGRDGPVSEHGISYMTLIRGEGDVAFFCAWCEQYFLSEKDKGATAIVWRVKPEIMDFEEKRKHSKRLVLQFHLLPKKD